jgi:uncharacterized protein YeaO (DUF488 family)
VRGSHNRPVRDADPGRVAIGRVYDPPAGDGRARVLVDRLWPRGVAKDAAALDEWLRAVAPSAELRKWYRHEPGRFAEFRRRYREELNEPERRDAVDRLGELARTSGVVLLTATRDPASSNAAVLAEVVQAGLGSG